MKKYASYITLILLVTLIMWSSLWSPGGIVLLDFIITPHSYASLWQAIVFPFFDFLARVIGYDIVSKVFFFITLWSAGYLGILLGKRVSGSSKYQYLIESVGSIFFLINPYAYERMMVQPTIYMGTIALGYMMYYLLFSEHTRRYLWAGVLG